jgi:hypothetical protein
MRSKPAAPVEAIPPPHLPVPVSEPEKSSPKAMGEHIHEDEDEGGNSSDEDEYDLKAFEDQDGAPTPVPIRPAKTMPQKLNKVTLTFVKPRGEHNSSNSELNTSLTKKSTKIPPGGGAGPSTMILRDLNGPAVVSKKTFGDFQNPPSFLKNDVLPQLKGKSFAGGTNISGNPPKVSRLVALPQITETKGRTKNTLPRMDKIMDYSFEYRGTSGLDENLVPSGGGNGTKPSSKKSTALFPSIPIQAASVGFFLICGKNVRPDIEEGRDKSI